ncbi:general odorant-binding protein 69a-like [Colias croceus]|uniref:general odorant-binding protein 69a-like n=1 Tax=Colias crocea TaxID=72248 RepID=UPI001E27D74B|nr:general odorant-binding protein 69a-like [Colias croceus]
MGIYLLSLLLTLLISTSLAMDAEMAELAQMLRDSCASETGVDLTLVEGVNKGADLTPDDKLKCYMKCTMETAGMMSEGNVDVEAVIALLPDDFRKRSEHHLRACGTKKGTDDCDTAYQTQVCWQKSNKADYFLI